MFGFGVDPTATTAVDSVTSPSKALSMKRTQTKLQVLQHRTESSVDSDALTKSDNSRIRNKVGGLKGGK